MHAPDMSYEAEKSGSELLQAARRIRAKKGLLTRDLSLGLLQAQTKQWLATHAKRLPLPPLSPKVLAFIREWYYLVDTDGSGELSLDEVAAAMKKAGIPHTSQSVEELFNLVDIDGSGIMEWSEFETFVANEIQEGRDFMEGEFVLPSGAGIQFAAMVDVLRRKSRVQAVMKGGQARELTVAKMCAEVEANALYEQSAALARASGSRRLPKLRPSHSSPAGRALATQQSIPLHQLLAKQLSNAAGSAEQSAVRLQHTDLPHAGQGDTAAKKLQVKDLARIPGPHLMHTPQIGTQQQVQRQHQHQQQQPLVIGREAQLLLAPYKPPPAHKSIDPLSVKHTCLAVPAAADLGVAVVYEEKYHRAGREVLGQRIDAAAAALAAQERDAKGEKKRLGYTPLKHEAAALVHTTRDSSRATHSGAPDCFRYASAVHL